MFKFTISRPAIVCGQCWSPLHRDTMICTKNALHVGTRFDEEGCEVEVTVSTRFSRVVRGRYSGLPENCYPDEGGECLSFTARVDGRDFPLTDEEAEWMIEESYRQTEKDSYLYSDIGY